MEKFPEPQDNSPIETNESSDNSTPEKIANAAVGAAEITEPKNEEAIIANAGENVTPLPVGEQVASPAEEDDREPEAEDGRSPEEIIGEKVKAQIHESILGIYDRKRMWEDARSMSKEEFISSRAKELRDKCTPLIDLVNDMDGAPSEEAREARFRDGLSGKRSSIDLMAKLQAISDANSSPEDYAKADDEEFGTLVTIDGEEKRRSELISDAVNGGRVNGDAQVALKTCARKASIDKMSDGLAVVADNLEEALAGYYEKDKMRSAISKLESLAGIRPESEEE